MGRKLLTVGRVNAFGMKTTDKPGRFFPSPCLLVSDLWSNKKDMEIECDSLSCSQPVPENQSQAER